MAFCKNCGAQLEEGAKFCSSCGTAHTEQTPEVEIPVQEFVVPEMPTVEKASGNLNVAQLIWAIINLLACCTPLGIAALVLTVIAKDAATAEEEAKKLKTAKTCNLIGTIGVAVGMILYIVFVVVMAMLGTMGA
jgi:uncharacterized membrane protein YvbJ